MEGFFGSDGILSQSLPDYEVRDAQGAMAESVATAIREEKIALIEAGTGTGKTLAYGAPALMAAMQEQKRIVISTHTINLQQQLVEKDLPFLLKTLQADLKVVLVKGMYNYLCLRKLGDALLEKGAYPLDQIDEMESIESWSKKTDDGSRSGLNYIPSSATWERVGCELDACSQKRCPHYKECFFMRARKCAEDAQVLVVNHHLLLADLALKAETDEGGILPDYDILILDEAHHLEDVATESWAKRLTRFEWIKLLSRLIQDKGSTRTGKLPLLEKQVGAYPNLNGDGVKKLLDKLSWELPAEKKRLIGDVNDLFSLFAQFLEEVKHREDKLRLVSDHLEHPFWKGEIASAVEGVVGRMSAFSQSLHSLDDEISALHEEGLCERTSSVRLDIKALRGRIEAHGAALRRITFDEIGLAEVRWIESFTAKGFAQSSLVSATLDVSTLLSERIFEKIPSVILTSATLTTSRSFAFIRSRLGLDDLQKEVTESAYDSPFSYRDQALLVVPSNMPSPSHEAFVQSACASILDAVCASKGGAFLLFTSFKMLRACHDQLKGKLLKLGHLVLRQGETERSLLLETFREKEDAVLFGTDSFWEGVDVIGRALRLVVLAKLPFQVPTEPIIQARLNAIADEGGDPFSQYSVPQAVVKFKQGFGRLIRARGDRGCILCLDNRLTTKSYGKQFLNSLPPCATAYEKSEDLKAVLNDFYKSWSVAESNR